MLKKNGLTIALVAGILAVVAWYFFRSEPGPAVAQPPAAVAIPAPATSASLPAESTRRPTPPATPGAPANSDRSDLADALNAPTGNIRADLRCVQDIFVSYQTSVHGPNPVGDNAEITATLTGRNKLAYAFIPPDCPAINVRGELCDRWGTPFLFHQLSGAAMEIRSAGPDRKWGTPDDVALTPEVPGLHL